MKTYFLLPILFTVSLYTTSCKKIDPTPSSSSTTTSTGNGSVSTATNSNATTWTAGGITYSPNSNYPTWVTLTNILEMVASGTATDNDYTSQAYLYLPSSNPASGTYTLVSGNYSNLSSNQAYFSLVNYRSSNTYAGAFAIPNTISGFATVSNNGGTVSISLSNVKLYGYSSYKSTSGSTITNITDSLIVSGTFVK